MDPRTAAHVLVQIAEMLELHGANRFKAKAYKGAARALLSLETDDLDAMLRTGELARVPGIGPATLNVLRDLIENGESTYLRSLRGDVPEGVFEMLKVPGLGSQKVQRIYEDLGIASVDELEAAAAAGKLNVLPGFGAKTAEKILKGIAFMRETVVLRRLWTALPQSEQLIAMVRRHPDIVRAELAGSLRRRREVVRDFDIVAGCSAPPERVAESFARMKGVRHVFGEGASRAIKYVDGTVLDLHCVPDDRFVVALWRATGSAEHVTECLERAAAKGVAVEDDQVRAKNRVVKLADETELYRAFGMSYVEPELREGLGEVAAAAENRLPSLIVPGDIRGVLHCHTTASDGTASIEDMARAAIERGYDYLGITDHSEAAFYAGGLSRDAVLEQHEAIDAVNAKLKNFRVLKGIEADLLADGRVDYGADFLHHFDYVVGSIHSRFKMKGAAMTDRVLAALDDPYLTILGHPTGRLLLSREPYDIDLEAVIEKAVANGVALELNCDPHRLDLDWRYVKRARELGATIEIGPDAHSEHGLDYMRLGEAMGRKGWLEPGNVLNCGSADDILAFARRRRAGATMEAGAARH